MNPSKGYYSLIQYCPDLGRIEAANIGVLLFCPERGFFQASTARDNRRIIQFFGTEGHDWERINAFKKGLVERIEHEAGEIRSIEDLHRFIGQRANLLQITAPRPMRVVDPTRDLEELANEILGEAPKKKSARSLRKLVDDKLTSARLENIIRRDIKVTVPLLQKEIDVPFGFQNGRFNLICPVPFRAATPEQSFRTACKYAIEGNSLYEHRDPQFGPLQLVIIAKFREHDQASPQLVERVLKEYHVKIYRTTDLSRLIDEIRTTGKMIPGAAN